MVAIHQSRIITFNMPSAVTPEGANALKTWKRPEKTSQDLPWANIKVIDLAKFDAPGGKQELAEELRQAVSVPDI